MRHFCTSVDSGRLFKGLALYHSLTRHAPGSVLWVLCLDQATERVIGALPLPGLHVLPLAELEAAEPGLRAVRSERTPLEYRFTCTPALLWHLLTRVPDVAPITHLDADVYFLANPAPVLEDSVAGSITITPRRIAESRRDLAKLGRYDSSWLTFMDDRIARECLAWWRNRCIEWCYDRVEDGKFAHLKYLDDWPTRFEGVHVLAHPGAAVAPWNVATHPVSLGGQGLRVGGGPLVSYRFDGFERVTSWLFDPGLARHGAKLTPILRDDLYLPYLAELRAIESDLRREVPKTPQGWRGDRGLGLAGLIRGVFGRELLVAR